MTETVVEGLVDRLRPAAADACNNAHAPYSRFPVGAALLGADGAVHSGCNVENASFGLTVCAERNALAQAIASGLRAGQVQALLIYTPGDVAHTPCGACRQVMHELLDPAAVIVSCCDGRDIRSWAVDQLIPDPFEL